MIPKKLHFTYKTHALPKKYKRNLKEWRRLYPEWELHYYTDKDIQLFFEAYFPEYAQDLVKISVGAIMADVFRYAAIYIHGGLYSDIDTVPLKKISAEWLNYEAVIGYEYQPEKFPQLLNGLWKYEPIFCQWTFLSCPKNPLFKAALDRSFQRLRSANFVVKRCVNTLFLSGPLLFSAVVREFEGKSNQLFLDADYFATDPAKQFDVTDRSVIQHQFDGHKGWELNVLLPHINLGAV